MTATLTATTPRAEIARRTAALTDAALLDAWETASHQYDTARHRFLHANTADALDHFAAQQIVRSALFDEIDARWPDVVTAWADSTGDDDDLRVHVLAANIATLATLLGLDD